MAKLGSRVNCIVGFIVEDLSEISRQVKPDSTIFGSGFSIDPSAEGHIMGSRMTEVFHAWVMKSHITMDSDGVLQVEMPLDSWVGLYEDMKRVVDEWVVEDPTRSGEQS
jgi:hypothetical protein